MKNTENQQGQDTDAGTNALTGLRTRPADVEELRQRLENLESVVEDLCISFAIGVKSTGPLKAWLDKRTEKFFHEVTS